MNLRAIDLSLARLLPDRVPSPWSWATHIPFAFFAVQVLRPRVFVELGTHAGTSFLAFCQAAQTSGDSNTKYFAVDTWEGDQHAGNYGPEVYETLSAYLNPRYGSFAVLLRKYFDEALADFADGSVDLLHIDGLHTYEAVKHDFETWLPKMSSRGVVLFHDTQVFEREFGVYRLWRQLLEKGYQGFEFLHGHGLGVLGVGDRLPAPFDSFLHFAQKNVDAVRERFAQLGLEVLANAELEERRARARIEGGTMRFAADEILRLAQELEHKEGEVAGKDVVVSEQASAIRSIAEQLKAREGACLSLSNQVVERDGQIASLNQAVVERDGQIASLNQAVVERDGQIASLNQAVVERDGQIASLNQAVVERDGQTASLNQAVVERDGQSANLNQALA